MRVFPKTFPLLILILSVCFCVVNLGSKYFLKEQMLEFLGFQPANIPFVYVLLQNALIILAIVFYLHKRIKTKRLTKAKLVWLKNRIYQQLHSKEFQILCKMIESDYLQILAFEWVDELGQHVQVRNCHRVTRNYFKNSGAFVKKMKRKIRKKLRELNFRFFNKYFERIFAENKQFNVFDHDDILTQNLNLQPNPSNFFGRINMIELEELGGMDQGDDPRRMDNLLDEEDYPEHFEEEMQPQEPLSMDHQRNPAIPPIKVEYKDDSPFIPKLVFTKKADLGMKSEEEQLRILYSEINQISLAIEAKVQFLKLDFYRKFATKEFEEYSKKKFKIDKKMQIIEEEIRNSFCAGILQNIKKFESEKESVGQSQHAVKLKAKEKKKMKKKTREGNRQNFW